MKRISLSRLFLALLLSQVLHCSSAFAQSSSVELLGTVPVSQVKDGLGFNLDPGQDWQWQAAAAAGATHARMQCSWSIVEKQTPPPANTAAATRYVQDPNCAAGFDSARKYGIHPTVVAAYGPPSHSILTVTVPQGAPAGATTFEIEFLEGSGGDTLANLKVPYDYICPLATSTGACSSQFSSRHSYQGTLISAVTILNATHARVSVASALTQAIPADATPYRISEILYPSAASERANDPSVAAYGDYVEFLANDMASRGISGDIEIWNEPPWSGDPWDYRAGLYDVGLYDGSAESGANFGFAANLMARKFPSGVTATWNGTSGNGMSSLLGAGMASYSGEVLNEPSTVLTKESFHPYWGTYGNPEEQMFKPGCLEKVAMASTWPSNNPFPNGMFCDLPGVSDKANAMYPFIWDFQKKATNPTYGIGHAITETNEVPPIAGLRMQQSKGIMRQFIGFQANGFTPIEFFKLFDGSLTDPNFSFVEPVGATTNYTPHPDYTALSAFMQDILPISNAPVQAYTAASLPSVSSYTGTYALASVNLVGSRAKATSNSDAFVVWQISACTTTTDCWFTLPAPAPALVSVNLPSSLKVQSVIDTVTRATISYTQSSGKLSFEVSDDPIEVVIDPAGESEPGTASAGMTATSLAVLANPLASTFGQQVSLVATLKPYASKTNSSNGALVNFYAGRTLIGSAPLSSGLAVLNTTSLPAGKVVIGASFGGNSHFFASSAQTTITVSSAAPTLKLPAIGTQVNGWAPFPVTATSTSPAQISYKILSGPARVSAMNGAVATIQSQGVGIVVLQAVQLAAGNYAAGSTQTTFTIEAAQDPGLSINAIPAKTYGTAPFAITATSKSTAAIVYAVVNGPAKLSGSTVTLTGSGTVVLQASQPAAGKFTKSLVRTSLIVQGGPPTLKLPAIGTQINGSAPFPVTATSTSPARIYYKILSGPARISAINGAVATVQLQGVGSVVLQASQFATGNYAATSTQTTFTIEAAQNPGLSIVAIPAKTFGTAPFPITATSKSTAAIVYAVVNGPAKLSGNTVTLTGSGTVVLQASQPAADRFTSSLVRTSLVVQGAAPTLKLPAIGRQINGRAPFSVTATSTSPARIYYKILSGPARISAINGAVATVQLQGVGSVVLQASQFATGNYAAALTQTTFAINSK